MTKSKPITIIVISLILIGAITFFLIRPVVSSVWNSWRNLEKARSDLKNVEEKKSVLLALEKNKDLQSVGDIVLKYIPKDSQSGELVIELTAIAQQNNLKVEETSMEKVKTATKEPASETATPTPKGKTSPTPTTSASPAASFGGASEVPFSMKLSGTFQDFMNFLNTIESSARLILINNISMQTKAEGTDKTSSFAVQLTGVAFYKSIVTVDATLQNIKVSDDTLNKFLNLKTYGQPINLPTESGFGRGNPFEGY